MQRFAFQTDLSEVRQEVAERHLREGRLAIAEIAFRSDFPKRAPSIANVGRVTRQALTAELTVMESLKVCEPIRVAGATPAEPGVLAIDLSAQHSSAYRPIP
jgi:hypothetical protein